MWASGTLRLIYTKMTGKKKKERDEDWLATLQTNLNNVVDCLQILRSSMNFHASYNSQKYKAHFLILYMK